ncbi:MAG: hypothetical protein WC947_08110 [Elusimicrobiota bacterium]
MSSKKMMDVVTVLKITPKSAILLIKDFEKLKFLREMTGFKRNKQYLFEDYLKLFIK